MTAVGVAPFVPRERKKVSVPACVKNDRARIANEIDEAIQDWQAETVQRAKELGDRFGKKPEYFLSLFYGQEIKDSDRKARALSLRDAWLWSLSEEHTVGELLPSPRRRLLLTWYAVGGGRQQLFDLQLAHQQEYEALKGPGKEKEREELLERYKVHKESEEKGRRVTPRSMSMVVYNGCKQIEETVRAPCFQTKLVAHQFTADLHAKARWCGGRVDCCSQQHDVRHGSRRVLHVRRPRGLHAHCSGEGLGCSHCGSALPGVRNCGMLA